MENNFIIFLRCLLLLFTSFFLSNRLCKVLISVQNKSKQGQEISTYLMESHQEKKSTPTLGGLGIILSILISSLLICNLYLDKYFLCGMIILVSFSIIGLIDDLIKVLKRNYHGLSSTLRVVLEGLIVIIIFYILDKDNLIDSYFSFNDNTYLNFSNLIVIFIVFLIVGSANSVNLTDGLDGLSGGVYLISLLPFIIFLLLDNNMSLVYLLLMIYGSTLGFLVLNLHPAKIFMGDTGSLSLGGILGYIALVSKKELLLILIGGIFVFETISVILQVIVFKTTKKRIFKMSPFHHHLELMGKKEYTIVMLFYVIGFTLSLISLIVGLIL